MATDTAYGKNLINGQWYFFNDSSVSPAGHLDSMKNSQAYVLFYARRSRAATGAVSPVEGAAVVAAVVDSAALAASAASPATAAETIGH